MGGISTNGQENRIARGTARSRDNTGVAANRVEARRDVRDRERNPVVPEEQATQRYGGCRKAGAPDVGRHAAATACDGKGIRVDGQYRTRAGSVCLDGQRIAHKN